MDIGDRNAWGWDFCGAGCILFIGLSCYVDVFLLLSSTVYVFQIFIYFTVKKGTKKFKALNCYRLFSHTVPCKDQLMVCWKPFSFPPNGVKISSFCSPRWVWNWLLFSSQYNAGLVRQCGRRYKKLQGSPKDWFSNGSGAWLWFYTSHGTTTVTIFQLLKSIR